LDRNARRRFVVVKLTRVDGFLGRVLELPGGARVTETWHASAWLRKKPPLRSNRLKKRSPEMDTQIGFVIGPELFTRQKMA
jgi:hypothetical protein